MYAAAPCTVENSNQQPGTACQCLPGFKGEITWSGHTHNGTCTATKCTGLTFGNGNVVKSNGDRHGSMATFTCNEGFVLTDTSSTTCNAAIADATWPTPPSCVGMLFEMTLRTQLLSHSRVTLFGVLCAGQTCTLSIADVENKYFYSVNTSDGNCSRYKNESEGVFTWIPGDSCNFKCAEGYFAANGNAILIRCSANLNKTSLSGVQNPLTPCARA